ncbi:iron-sulfur cluster biosynthesis family protein [Bacillus alkalicellulosilyticus]|uniref:iron-sulfur cluster biosynthesis family protein n=1 Tax=Alkalihalobacterium alkalicellulosilyticum TaxID=1912214 RepID=UPI0009975E16|nr:iron-sulfur cluster biosynthesis family protein [Bacillus alkalicellulosilyticus]
MHMTISQEAVSFYKTEISLQPGDALRLFVRVGGVGSGGFSVGVQKDEPQPSSYRMTHENILFFVNEDDFWYMDGMVVDYNSSINLMTFTNEKWKNSDHPE